MGAFDDFDPRDDYRPGVQRRPRMFGAEPDPTVRWGDSLTLTFGGLLEGFRTGDLARVNLPHPAVCRVHFHAEVTSTTGANALVGRTRLILRHGVGSSLMTVEREYQALPQVGFVFGATTLRATELDVTWQIPLNQLYATVSATGLECSVVYSLHLTPLTPVDFEGDDL